MINLNLTTRRRLIVRIASVGRVMGLVVAVEGYVRSQYEKEEESSTRRTYKEEADYDSPPTNSSRRTHHVPLSVDQTAASYQQTVTLQHFRFPHAAPSNDWHRSHSHFPPSERHQRPRQPHSNSPHSQPTYSSPPHHLSSAPCRL